MLDEMEISRLQCASANVWPAKHYFFLNGWLLRFSDDSSNRANSVLPGEYYGSNAREDIEIVEKAYRAFGKDPKFVIHKYVKPEGLEELLIECGYQKLSRSLDVMTCRVADFVKTGGNQDIVMTSSLHGDGSWFDFLASTDDRIPDQVTTRIILPSKQFISASKDGEIVGTAFAVLDPRGYLYIANLVVDNRYRRKRIATSLMSRVIAWGMQQGAIHAWFHVDSENDGAITMYKRMGFEWVYRYGYYCKE
ncbi:MAG: GNAT family N-acetyltransferase [Candidatus Odinarchaeota archaeon]